MRSITNIVGIILIIVGIIGLGYQGISYTKQEKIAQIGSVKITAEKEHTIFFPPMLAGASLLAGIVLVIVARNSRM